MMVISAVLLETLCNVRCVEVVLQVGYLLRWFLFAIVAFGAWIGERVRW